MICENCWFFVYFKIEIVLFLLQIGLISTYLELGKFWNGYFASVQYHCCNCVLGRPLFAFSDNTFQSAAANKRRMSYTLIEILCCCPFRY